MAATTTNFTTLAFGVTFSGSFVKVNFPSIPRAFYFNVKLFNIRVSPLGDNFVDLGEFDWGILTVNYLLCTSPVNVVRTAWMQAVLDLITIPNFAPTTLAAASATDSVVGYNNTTKQFTDLGNVANHKFYVYNTVAQAVAAGGTTVLYNTILEDPVSGYNAATGLYTIQAGGAGPWIFGMSGSCVAAQVAIICLNGATAATHARAATVMAATGSCSAGFTCAVGDTIRVLYYLNNTNLSVFGKNNNFWGKKQL